MQSKTEFITHPLTGAMAQSIAWVSGLFAAVLAILLIADHVRLLQMDPLNDPTLMELRTELAASSQPDPELTERIRTYDLYARRAFFANQTQRQTGGWLVLGGTVVCFLSLKLYRLARPKKPDVSKHERINHADLNILFRQLMAGTGLFLAAVALFLAFAVRSDLETVLTQSELPEQAAQQTPEQPTGLPAAFRSNWPSLRGPGNIGVAAVSNAPIFWDVESGENVRWKTKVPVHGFNSPVVWGDRIFMTGADAEGQKVFCFDADGGTIRWQTFVPAPSGLPEVTSDTGQAAPTAATDGERLYVIFASGELAALDMKGQIVWQQSLGMPENPYGMGSSLICDASRVFVQFDHQARQQVMAFDGTSGRKLWTTPRAHISWASPSLIETERGMQLVLNDELNVTAYTPADGSQLWQVECLGGEVAPSPTFNGKGILFVGNEYAQATALRLTGGTPEVLWQYDEWLPEIASPVAAEKMFFIATTAGDIICLDAQTGEVKWEQIFDEGFNASPILVGNRVYAIDLSGKVSIFKVADTYHEIASIDLGEQVYATPAFVDGRIYIRGETHLFCIEQK